MVDHWAEFKRDLWRSAMTKAHQVFAGLSVLIDLGGWWAAIRFLGVTMDAFVLFHAAFMLALAVCVWLLFGTYDAIAVRRDAALADKATAERDRDEAIARLADRTTRQERKEALAVLMEEMTAVARRANRNSPVFQELINDWGERVMVKLTVAERAQFMNHVGLLPVYPDMDGMNPADWTQSNALRFCLQRLGEIIGRIPD